MICKAHQLIQAEARASTHKCTAFYSLLLSLLFFSVYLLCPYLGILLDVRASKYTQYLIYSCRERESLVELLEVGGGRKDVGGTG